MSEQSIPNPESRIDRVVSRVIGRLSGLVTRVLFMPDGLQDDAVISIPGDYPASTRESTLSQEDWRAIYADGTE